MTERREWTYTGPHGRRLRAVLWTPAGPVRGMVQVVHGLMGHVMRYDETARFLCERGFAVCGIDLPGHGCSESDAPACFARRHGWDVALAAVRSLRGEIGGTWPYWFVLGHSMGSFLVRTWLIRWPGETDGVLLSGTAQKPQAAIFTGRILMSLACLLCTPLRPIPGAAPRFLRRNNRRVPHPVTDRDWVSRDPAVPQELLADPLCQDFPTAGLLRDMLAGMQYNGSPARTARMDPATPVYFFSGTDDPVGDYGVGVRRAAALFASCRDVTVRLYPGGRHEMLHETNRARVFDDLAVWLDAHMTKKEASP